MDCKITRKIIVTILLFDILSQGISSNFDKAVNDFSLSIYSNAINGSSNNVLLSPIFLQDALAVLFSGANGQTARDLAKGLNFGTANRDQVVESFHKFMRSAKRLDPTSITLDIANKFYVEQNVQISNEFKGYACQLYSYVEPIDFSNTTVTATMINSWVGNHTNNTIPVIVTPDSFGPDPNLVVLSASNFKGFWKHKFDIIRTAPEYFHYNNAFSISSNFMHVKNEFMYGNIDSLSATTIDLPYNISDVSMLILLPNDLMGITTLESKLLTIDLPTIVNGMSIQTVDVSLPRISFGYAIDLKNVLTQMGMGIIYSDQADFTPLHSDHKSLKVSSLLTGAHIVFHEDGADASPATGTDWATTDVIQPKTFVADHPFLFIVKKGLDILFIGRVMYPVIDD